MNTVCRIALLSLAVLVPASSRAQANNEPFVLVTPSAGPSGYVHVNVGICHNRQIITYIFLYGGNDFSSYMSGNASAAPGWCTAIYPDPSFEDWNGDVPELCGQNWFNVQVVDYANYGGGDSDHYWTGPSCQLSQVAFAPRPSIGSSLTCDGGAMAWQPARISNRVSGLLRSDA